MVQADGHRSSANIVFFSEKHMHPSVECFHQCLQAPEPEIEERRSLLGREYLLATSERCRGFLLWIYNLHRWQLYQPVFVHHFIDVCLEDFEPPASIFWWMASFLHSVYPWPELRLRIARRITDIGGVCKGETNYSHGIECALPASACLSMPRTGISWQSSFSRSFYKATDMADHVLADDLARLVAFKRHLCHAFLKPEMLSEVRHGLLESASGCAKRFRLGQDGGLRWGTSSCWNVNAEDQQRIALVLHASETVHFPRLLTKDSLKKNVGKRGGLLICSSYAGRLWKASMEPLRLLADQLGILIDDSRIADSMMIPTKKLHKATSFFFGGVTSGLFLKVRGQGFLFILLFESKQSGHHHWSDRLPNLHFNLRHSIVWYIVIFIYIYTYMHISTYIWLIFLGRKVPSRIYR